MLSGSVHHRRKELPARPPWGSPEKTGSRLQSPTGCPSRGGAGGLGHLAAGNTPLSRDCLVLWQTLRSGSTAVSQRPPPWMGWERCLLQRGEAPGGSRPGLPECILAPSTRQPGAPAASLLKPEPPPPRRQGVSRDTSAVPWEFGRVWGCPLRRTS